MGSSDTGMGAVDCTIGSIVWVRRRNGSWWPGKILGPDELSASHLMSPRSGTPVKLLGREDASVDWYNLEKSKRVKTFRCGEFDDCIERAEASQGMPPKKREKYARREDAILHALELEKQYLEKQHGKLGCSSNQKSEKLSVCLKTELTTSAESSGYHNGENVRRKSHQPDKRTDSTRKEKRKGHHLCTEGVEDVKQPSGDCDNSDILPRMKGLQDFGLRTTPSMQKISSSVISNGSQEPALDESCSVLPNDGHSTEGAVLDNHVSSLENRKRSSDGLADELPVKRHDRHHPLLQVLENSAKLHDIRTLDPGEGDRHLCVSGKEHAVAECNAKMGRNALLTDEPHDLSEDKETHLSQMEAPSSKFEQHFYQHSSTGETISGSTEDTETDSSETDSLESEGDEVLSDDGTSIELKPKYPGKFEMQWENRSLRSEEPDDLPHPFSRDLVSASEWVSKWQLKGKRNSRNLSKRSLDISGGKFSRGPSHGIYMREKELYGCDESDLTDKNFMTRVGGYVPGTSDGTNHNILDWEILAWNDQPTLKGYWEDSSKYFDSLVVGRRHSGGRMKSMLIDVDLKVQSSYQKEHVPMISLMSKLNGQAIIGHPIHIEALENGSSETLLAADNDAVLPSTWKTARRTANFRVPRPHPSLDGDEAAELIQHVDHDKNISSRKSSGGSSGHKTFTPRRNVSAGSSPLVDKKFPRKPLRRISLSSNQKTRTLSSIATQQNHIHDLKHSSNSYQMDGLIKPESLPTAVACIPVKLVFSRLHEELIDRHK